MRCRYTFKVESGFLLDPPICFEAGRRNYKFLADGQRRLVALQVEVTNYPSTLWPTFSQQQVGMPTLDIPLDPHLISLVSDLQASRGALALWGVQDIDLEFPRIEWIAETEEEKRALEVSDYNIQRNSALPLVVGPLDMLVRCVLCAKQFVSYEIQLDFYRRSLEDMRNGRYIEAIYDLWFILEYSFGGGVYSKTGIERSFREHYELRQALSAVRTTWNESLTKSEGTWEEVRAKYIAKSDEEIIAQLIEMRGFLHHQSFKRKVNWSPMRQREYEADAVFLRYTCQQILMKVSCDILFADEALHEFQSTKVTDPKGRIINWRPYSD